MNSDAGPEKLQKPLAPIGQETLEWLLPQGGLVGCSLRLPQGLGRGCPPALQVGPGAVGPGGAGEQGQGCQQLLAKPWVAELLWMATSRQEEEDFPFH